MPLFLANDYYSAFESNSTDQLLAIRQEPPIRYTELGCQACGPGQKESWPYSATDSVEADRSNLRWE